MSTPGNEFEGKSYTFSPDWEAERFQEAIKYINSNVEIMRLDPRNCNLFRRLSSDARMEIVNLGGKRFHIDMLRERLELIHVPFCPEIFGVK